MIGIGPVNVMDTPRLLTPLSSWSLVNSPQTHIPSSGTGFPFASNSHGRSSIEMLSRRFWVFSIISFGSISLMTATAIIARSRRRSSPSKHPLSSAPSAFGSALQTLVFLASLSKPGVGEPSFSYISPMIRSIVV